MKFPNKIRQFSHIREKGPVSELHDLFFKQKHHCRKHGHAAHDSNDYALDHDDSKIFSKREGHEDQCREACNGRKRTSYNRDKSLADCFCHGIIPVFITRPALFITVKEKDRVVRRNSQLQNRNKRLRNIGNISQEQIASHIISNCQTDAGQEEKRNRKGIRSQDQHQQREKACYHDISWNLFHSQILNIRNNSAHTADETLLSYLGSHLFNRFHGRLRRRGLIEQRDHHRGISLKKRIRHRTRNHADRHVDPHKIIVPQYLFHMIDCFNLLFQCNHIFLLHPVYHNHGECAHAEFIHHDVLSCHCFQRVRQITQNIIVDLCGNEPDG